MNKSTQERTEANEKLQPYKIQILSRDDIDTERYDRCVANSINETPLAYSWVLDYLNPHWEGLVINDYEGVMPIPIQKQLGFQMVQMPIEVLTLGIFSENNLLVTLFPEVLFHPVFHKFKFIQYNGSPSESGSEKKATCLYRETFILNLNASYHKLYRAYSRNHRRSLKHFEYTGLKISTSPLPYNFTHLINEVGKRRPELFMPHNYQQQFEAMAQSAIQRQMGSTYSVWKKGELIGAAFFLEGKKRIIPYHLANKTGRNNKTSFALIDQFIKDRAGCNKIIDFSGSTLSNVATFNRRFGARQVYYCSFFRNHLPHPFKWIKEKNLLFKFKRSFLR